jgi:hypothetical protein
VPKPTLEHIIINDRESQMKIKLDALAILISVFALHSCASFSPVVMDDYNTEYIGKAQTMCSNENQTQTKKNICIARRYTFETTKKYKNAILEGYKETNEYDNSILGAVTLGVAAKLASAHTDVFNVLAVSLGYQTAIKTYNSQSFKLQLYSNVIRATQCIYNNSSRLEADASTADTIKTARDEFIAFQTLPSKNLEKLKVVYEQQFESRLGDFSEFALKISKAEELATQALDAFGSAEATIIQAMQEIEITVIQRFNGQLPDINQISTLIEQQITANKKIEDSGSVAGVAIQGNVQEIKKENLTDEQKSLSDDDISIINEHIKRINSVTEKLNTLASLRLEIYSADINLIKSCHAAL